MLPVQARPARAGPSSSMAEAGAWVEAGVGAAEEMGSGEGGVEDGSWLWGEQADRVERARASAAKKAALARMGLRMGTSYGGIDKIAFSAV